MPAGMAVQVLEERTTTATRPSHYTGPATIHSRAPVSEKASRGLGLFSLGLAAAFLARPGGTARFAGVNDGSVERGIIAGVGLRELVPGIGLLMQAQPAGWVWSRVAGDTMDVSFVAYELFSGRAKKRERATKTLLGLIGITAVDAFVAWRLAAGAGNAPQVATLTVNGSLEDVTARWSGRGRRPSFRAAPGGRGTVVSLEVPRKEHGDAMEELRRFKQTFEAGEAARSDATVEGNGMPQPPARPRGR